MKIGLLLVPGGLLLELMSSGKMIAPFIWFGFAFYICGQFSFDAIFRSHMDERHILVTFLTGIHIPAI